MKYSFQTEQISFVLFDEILWMSESFVKEFFHPYTKLPITRISIRMTEIDDEEQ